MAQARASLTIELLASESGAPPSEFCLFKAGKTKTLKGDFVYSQRSVEAVQKYAAELGRELIIDYEHASLDASKAVDPSKAGEAAGWFSVDARADGLYATNVSWTADAAEKLAARKFRFFSPVIFFDAKSREVTGVFNAALTGNPATNHQVPLVASATTQEKPMEKLFAALLSLPAEASEAQVLSAIEALKASQATLLAATGKATVGEAVGTINAWKAASERTAALTAELEALKATTAKAEVDALVKAAVADKRATPAQVEALTKMGLRDVAELRAFLEASPKVLGTTVTPPAQDGVALSSPEMTVAAMLGVDPKAVAATKARLTTSAP